MYVGDLETVRKLVAEKDGLDKFRRLTSPPYFISVGTSMGDASIPIDLDNVRQYIDQKIEGINASLASLGVRLVR